MPNAEETSDLESGRTIDPCCQRDGPAPALAADTIEKLSILEVGGNVLFKSTYPNQTELIWAGGRPPSSMADATATPEVMLRVLRDLNAGRYDVVVAYPPLYSPAHPRQWGRSFFYRPWRPWSALTRGWGTSYLRFGSSATPLVVVDFEDGPSIGSPMAALLDRAKLAFKRELPTDRWRLLSGVAHAYLPTPRVRHSATWARRLASIRPINLPIRYAEEEFASNAFPDKTTDVFFAGAVALNSTLRVDGRAELERMRDLGLAIDCPDQRLPFREFCARMSHAWLTWSPEGLGWQCFRHAEACLLHSVPVINYPTIVRATPLEEGMHAFYYPPEPGELTQTILRALADKQRLKRMACSARAYAAAHFTIKACCDYILAAALEDAS